MHSVGLPSNHSETVSNFFWSSFEPIIIISVFPVEGLNLLDLGWVAWELRKVGETIDDILWPVMTSYNINPSNEPSSQVIICFDTSFNQNVCWKAKQLHKKSCQDCGWRRDVSVPTRSVWDTNKHGGAHVPVAAVAVKTAKYSGRTDWEAFHAQFALLADAGGWTVETLQALQLALCLTADTFSYLLLRTQGERHDYRALAGHSHRTAPERLG